MSSTNHDLLFFQSLKVTTTELSYSKRNFADAVTRMKATTEPTSMTVSEEKIMALVLWRRDRFAPIAPRRCPVVDWLGPSIQARGPGKGLLLRISEVGT